MLLKQLTVFLNENWHQEQYSEQRFLVIKGLEEPGDEEEKPKIAATIRKELGISRKTVIKSYFRYETIFCHKVALDE